MAYLVVTPDENTFKPKTRYFNLLMYVYLKLIGHCQWHWFYYNKPPAPQKKTIGTLNTPKMFKSFQYSLGMVKTTKN